MKQLQLFEVEPRESFTQFFHKDLDVNKLEDRDLYIRVQKLMNKEVIDESNFFFELPDEGMIENSEEYFPDYFDFI